MEEDTLLGTLSISDAKKIFATKEELQDTKAELKSEIRALGTRMDKVESVVDKLTVMVFAHGEAITDIQNRLGRIEPIVETIHSTMDSIVVMLKRAEEERLMSYSRFKRIEGKQETEEKKVKKLDSRIKRIETTLQPA